MTHLPTIHPALLTAVDTCTYWAPIFLVYNGMLVPVRTSFNLRWRREITYQPKVNMDKLNALKVVRKLTFQVLALG